MIYPKKLKNMSIELKSRKVAVLFFCTAIGFMFLGCQTIEETVSQKADFYDYEARYYEPAVGRFSTTDPVAEKYPSISPYAYKVKTPIYIDLQGDSLTVAKEIWRAM